MYLYLNDKFGIKNLNTNSLELLYSEFEEEKR